MLRQKIRNERRKVVELQLQIILNKHTLINVGCRDDPLWWKFKTSVNFITGINKQSGGLFSLSIISQTA